VKIEGEVLVAGLGSIGERHVRNLLALGQESITVLRRNPREARTVDESAFLTVTDSDSALKRSPAALIIATPTAMHLPLIRQAVERGIPTMVEVPLASSVDGLSQLAMDAATNNTPVLVAHNLRFHPCLNWVRDAVRAGAAGTPIYSQAQFGEYLPDSHQWDDFHDRYEARSDLGGGVILTSIHEIDHAVWLFGEVSAVTCVAKTAALDIEVEDTAMLILEHRNGVLSQVTLDFVQRPYRRWLQVVGTEGTIEWELKANLVRRYTAEDGRWSDAFASPEYSGDQSYIDELEHFARVIRREEPPVVGLVEATHVLSVALAAKQSAVTGRRTEIEA
jgi:predicted dehydrogenase